MTDQCVRGFLFIYFKQRRLMGTGNLFQGGYLGVWTKSGHYERVMRSLMCKSLEDRRAQTDELHETGTSFYFPATNLH